MRATTAALIALLALAPAACSNGGGLTDPDPLEGVTFRLGERSYAIAGNPASESGRILSVSFAVARADSVGGFAVIGYQRTGEDIGDLIVLQAPRELRTFTCSDDSTPCDLAGGEAEWHGRFITGVRTLSTVGATRYFHIVSGTIAVTRIGPDRLRGTFTAVFRAFDGQSEEALMIDNGTIDVPYVTDPATDGSLQCLLAHVGAVEGQCEAP